MLNAVSVVLAEAARQEADDPEKKLHRLAYERESEARFQTELRGEKWESPNAGKHVYLSVCEGISFVRWVTWGSPLQDLFLLVVLIIHLHCIPLIVPLFCSSRRSFEQQNGHV